MGRRRRDFTIGSVREPFGGCARRRNGGVEGLVASYPRHRPRQVPSTAPELIRQARQDLGYGAARTRLWLQRGPWGSGWLWAPFSAFRDLGLPRLRRTRKRPPRQMKLFEKAEPGESAEVDVKYVPIRSFLSPLSSRSKRRDPPSVHSPPTPPTKRQSRAKSPDRSRGVLGGDTVSRISMLPRLPSAPGRPLRAEPRRKNSPRSSHRGGPPKRCICSYPNLD